MHFGFIGAFFTRPYKDSYDRGILDKVMPEFHIGHSDVIYAVFIELTGMLVLYSCYDCVQVMNALRATD